MSPNFSDVLPPSTFNIGGYQSESAPNSKLGKFANGFFGRIRSLFGRYDPRLSLSGSSSQGGTSPCHQLQQGVSVIIGPHSLNREDANKPSVATATTVAKDISFWGGLCLLICNTTGPGVVSLPLVAQSAGWVPTVVVFVLVGILSYLSCMFICEAMTEVPGNEHYQANVEFSNMVLCFFGRRYQAPVQIVCFLALQTTTIASIVICAQVFDNILIQIAHRTCGIQVYPHVTFICVNEQLSTSSPFSGTMIISTGALLAFMLIMPLCMLNLSENIWIQVVSCVLILVIFIQWIITFIQHGLVTSRVPAIGSDMSHTFESILFNYAFITAVPSWANAKKSHVSPQKTVGADISLMTTLFILVSVLAGMAYEIPSNSSMIQAIMSSPDVTTLSKIAGYTFPIVALVTSIPINMIVLRYNLTQSKTCSRGWATVLAGVLPWIVTIPCMTSPTLSTVVGWSSLFLVSTSNFIIPFVLYIYAKKYRARLMQMAPADRAHQERLDKEICGTLTAEEVAAEEIAAAKLVVPDFSDSEIGHSERSSEFSTQNDQSEIESIDGFSTRIAADMNMIMEKEHKDDQSAMDVSVDSLERDISSVATYPQCNESGGSWSEKLLTERFGVAYSESLTSTARLGSPIFESGLHDTSYSSCVEKNETKAASIRQHMHDYTADTMTVAKKESISKTEMHAVPLWSPVSGLVVAYCALTLLIIGISATIM
ncbi:hypothetical protein FBU30_004667 [Linnemannia zychae]|nr:hypothetical protein FBU30_004667 [Linnemannia zychae]